MRELRFAWIVWLLVSGTTWVMPAAAAEREATSAVVNPVFRSSLRPAIVLDGDWDFAIDPNGIGEDEKWFQPDKSWVGLTKLRVPGCWEAQGIGGPGMSKPVGPEISVRPLRGCYIGTAWYRRAERIPANWAGKQIWLKIGGVNAQGWFWVNGQHLGRVESYCGTYKFNVTDIVEPGQIATIVAKVRNDVPSGKGLFNWIHRFGGLYRGIELEATSAISIDDAYVVGDLDRRTARIHVRVRSIGTMPRNATLSADVQCLGIASHADKPRPAGRAEAKLDPNRTIQDFEIDVKLDPLDPWSPESPTLYRASIVLDTPSGKDEWIERFGVRKWEIRDNHVYLNNARYFIRGYGDDYIYPLTLCSPASRDEHRGHLRIAKDYGFNYVRHHTHCELPEFFEAADEIGVMVQPELPYYGPRPSAQRPEFFRPENDLRELNAHYRRYVSFATYCMGNEGHMAGGMDRRLYELAKALDPTRLVVHQDGGTNTVENSDFGRARVLHEYLNLAIEEDPRIEDLYAGALRAPRPLAQFTDEVRKGGIPAQLADECIDSGHELQRIYQKAGIEKARLDPQLDGYIYWTIVDVGSPSAQGLLNQFWGKKRSAAEYFHQFNGPTAILCDISPQRCIFQAGQKVEIRWALSQFPLAGEDRPIEWQLSGGETVFGRGTDKAGQISTVAMPNTGALVQARLIAALTGGDARNQWDLWIIPARKPMNEISAKLCAGPKVHAKLATAYPQIAKHGDAGADARELLIDTEFPDDAARWLAAGKRVLLVNLRPAGALRSGCELGWWTMTNQRGTVVARNSPLSIAAPDGLLSPLLFRMIGPAVRRSAIPAVPPLMAGHVDGDWAVYAFCAKHRGGRLLATTLDVLGDNPEARWLLDELVRSVMETDARWPEIPDISALKNALAPAAPPTGWAKTIAAAQTLDSYPSFMGPTRMRLVRQADGSRLVWQTQPVADTAGPTYTFEWPAALGYRSQPKGSLTLFLGDRKIVDFDVAAQSVSWRSADGSARLQYTMKAKDAEDSSGIMRLTVPSNWLRKGKPAELRVDGSGNSRRWFGIFESQ